MDLCLDGYARGIPQQDDVVHGMVGGVASLLSKCTISDHRPRTYAKCRNLALVVRPADPCLWHGGRARVGVVLVDAHTRDREDSYVAEGVDDSLLFLALRMRVRHVPWPLLALEFMGCDARSISAIGRHCRSVHHTRRSSSNMGLYRRRRHRAVSRRMADFDWWTYDATQRTDSHEDLIARR